MRYFHIEKYSISGFIIEINIANVNFFLIFMGFIAIILQLGSLKVLRKKGKIS